MGKMVKIVWTIFDFRGNQRSQKKKCKTITYGEIIDTWASTALKRKSSWQRIFFDWKSWCVRNKWTNQTTARIQTEFIVDSGSKFNLLCEIV